VTVSNPRRRRFFAGLAVLVLVVAAGFLIGRSRSSSAATTSGAAPGPVVLVPGYGGGTDSLEVLAVRLRAAGHTVSILQLAGDGTGDLQVQAKRLKATVDSLVAAGAPSVDVVGYSAGGVVTRLWASELGGAAHARRIVLLGSPNHGTEVAALGAAFGGSVCPAACKQLTPDSALLARLNQQDTPAGPQWVSMWTDQDEVVTPPDSARLDGAASFTVQSVCADAVVDHGTLPTNKVVEGLVVRALADAPFEQPGPQDCAAVSS
jgi:pimeloyl-ACP methyl ester carboxylesterase